MLPKGLRVVQWPIGVVSLGTLFLGFSAGIVLLIPYLLALGIWGLRAAKREARSGERYRLTARA